MVLLWISDPHFGQKLRFVDQHAGDRLLTMVRKNTALDIGVGLVAMRIAGQADPARDRAEAGTIVERGGPQRHAHAAFAVIECGLQQCAALACIHAGEVEIELGHALALAPGGVTVKNGVICDRG